MQIFVPLLAIVFITLKLTGHIDWSWLWVLSPIWIPGIIVALWLLLRTLGNEEGTMNRIAEYNYDVLRQAVEIIAAEKREKARPGEQPQVTQADVKRSRNPIARRQNVLLKRRLGG